MAPHEQRLERLPRLEGRADVRLWRTASPSDLVFGSSRTPVFVRAEDGAAKDALERIGVVASEGRWVPASLDSAALLEVLGAPGHLEVRSAPAHRPMLDLTVPEIGADRIHAGAGGLTAREGEGVLVGIIDTGIDLTHPAFVDAEGRSRVVAVWDQDGAGGPSPEPFGYGRWCTETDIVEESCTIGDPFGHGTHVAGIAAGADGVASRADIAVVRSDAFTQVADAVLFLTNLAEERGQPVAINVSVGGHYGPHDGNTPLEQFLESELEPGQVLVAAAGNDGDEGLHAGFELSAEPVRLGVEGVPWGRPGEVILQLWSEPDAVVELELELWVGGAVELRMPLHATGADFLDGSLSYQDRVLCGVAFGIELSMDHQHAEREVVLDPSVASAASAPSAASAVPDGAVLALRLSGRGRIDAWIRQTDYRQGTVRFAQGQGQGWVDGDGERTITVPATSPSVIAVGSYSVRAHWTSPEYGEQSVGPVPFGTLSAFSSHGPTLAPLFTGPKPDLVAPGSMIISARAVEVPANTHTIDDLHMVMQGTSMAAPHVTGTVALMLEANPSLTHAEVRRLLADSARFGADTGPVPSTTWGWGRLDAAQAVALAEASTTTTGCQAAPGGSLLALVALLGVRAFGARRRRAPR